MSMQYTEIFKVVKNENFQQKFFDIFLIFAQNIDCGYTLEPPRRGGSNEYPQAMYQDCASTEPPPGKTNNVVSDQVRHKPTCTVTEDSLKFRI